LSEFITRLLVSQALQFDPTLKAEIEYDMKQFERAKKDKLVGKLMPVCLRSKLH
jgi:hypothetical protein